MTKEFSYPVDFPTMMTTSLRSSPASDTETKPQCLDEQAERPARAGPTWLRPAVVERAIMAVDSVIITGCGAVLPVLYHLMTAGVRGKPNFYGAAGLLVAINFGLLIAVQDGYRLKSIINLSGQWRMTLATWTGLFAALLAIAFTMKVSDEFSRGATISFYSAGLIALLVWKTAAARWASHALRTGTFSNSKIVVIGEFGLSASSGAMVELTQHGYRVMRTLEISAKELASPLLMSQIGRRFEELISYARENQIEHVFLLINWNRQHAIDSILDGLKILAIPVHLVPDANVSRFLRYPLVNAGNIWTAELRRAPLSRRERAQKRLLDLIGACSALVVFAPVMLIVAILIRCTSPGPIFFRQTRNGFNGRAFRILKFRTMRTLEDGPNVVQATRNDPRVTSVGKWLRRTSIDELPQLFNVLNGDMSLIGPRPHAAAHNSEYEQLISQYAFRHHVRPGITGWAQVNGYRGETRTLELMQKRVEYDLWYINNWTIGLDIAILLRTALVGFFQRTAY